MSTHSNLGDADNRVKQKLFYDAEIVWVECRCKFCGQIERVSRYYLTNSDVATKQEFINRVQRDYKKCDECGSVKELTIKQVLFV